MDYNSLTFIGVVFGAAIGFSILKRRQHRQTIKITQVILSELKKNEKLTLPELVKLAGLPDKFLNRGKVMYVINPLVSRGILVQEEPPGTTRENRLDVLSFKLSKSDSNPVLN